MSFLTPIVALITGSIALPLLVLLYLMKRRRKKIPVSSTFLWYQAIDDLQINSPFQKLKNNLLLILQLLIFVLLLLAAARPIVKGNASVGQRVVILIDQSASMNALDGGC